MNKNFFNDKSWFPNAAALCAAVLLYVILSRISGIWEQVKVFIGYFRPLIFGCIIAYIVNPLANFFAKYIFGKMKKTEVKLLISKIFAFITVSLFLVFALITLIPQIISSVKVFSSNFDGYVASLNKLVDSLGLSATMLNIDDIISSSENLLNKIIEYIENNISNILSVSVNAGKGVFQWVVAFILSVYLLFGKEKLKKGAKRFIVALCGSKRSDSIFSLLDKCNSICNRYIVFNLLDCLIIGGANAIFMSVVGMQYTGLVSFVVAIANLIPTFGPVIGGALGAFILLMVKPAHALIFLIFTLILQFCDGYIIKPRLFGDSLGVSGLWILVAIIAGGGMFGVAGILLAIPAMAIIDLLYGSYLLPWLESRHKNNEYADRST